MAVSASAKTVATTATRLDTAQDDADSVSGQSIVVKNTGSNTIYLGGSGVTTAAGYPLAAGEAAAFDLSIHDGLYGIVAASTETARVLETGV